jgi:hypothetical protein
VRRTRSFVATDCLSEGVNLQGYFTAVILYDLAWNPTRHEQREGRIDRFGQRATTIRAITLYGLDNPVDGVVLDVLIRKHEAIKKSTGVSVAMPTNSALVMQAVFEGLILRGQDPQQQALFEMPGFSSQQELFDTWQQTADRRRAAPGPVRPAVPVLRRQRAHLPPWRKSLGNVGGIRLGANTRPSSTTPQPPCEKCNLTPCFCD